MDLGAFLPPGGSYPIKIKDKTAAEETRGRVREHRGRPFWTVAGRQAAGRIVTITVEAPGFTLDDDGSLAPAGPASVAYIIIVGQVKKCRFIPAWRLYALRLNLLGRLWP